MGETGIASTLIRKTVELGGDRPYVVALGVFVVGILVGTVTGSAPAAMLVGIIGIPTMIAMGVPPITAAGTVVFGLSAGIPFELISWRSPGRRCGSPRRGVGPAGRGRRACTPRAAGTRGRLHRRPVARRARDLARATHRARRLRRRRPVW
jgi:hypothetical protein